MDTPSVSQGPPQGPLSGLARLARLAKPQPPQERCELCGHAIGEQHPHLLESKTRQLICVCEPCGILFSGEQQQRYRRVQPRATLLADLDISEDLWQSLHIPINLAFFYRRADSNKVVAVYPSPGGAIESLLPMDAWDQICAVCADARQISDVEAVIVNRVKDRRDCFLVSIDHCYKLVGLIRSNWRGFSGGDEAWRAIAAFFDDLHRRAIGNNGAANA
jgi:hypothetical protein